MPIGFDAEPDDILSVGDGHRQAAETKWDRLTDADLQDIHHRTQLIATIEERYRLPHEQALKDVQLWMSERRFSSWVF